MVGLGEMLQLHALALHALSGQGIRCNIEASNEQTVFLHLLYAQCNSYACAIMKEKTFHCISAYV